MFRNGQKRQLAPLYKKDGDEGGGGGGGGGGETFTAEQVQARIAEATAAAVEEAKRGLDEKNRELLGKLKQTKTDLERWGNLDPDQVKSMMATFENNEDMKLLAEGKADEVVNRRLEKAQAAFQSQLENLTSEKTTYEEKLSKANETIRDLMIDSKIVSAFHGQQGLDSAVPDVVGRAKAIFRVEDGEVVARDSKNELMRGKNGVLTIQEWVDSLKETAPHLFPGSGGGGFGSGSGGGGGDMDEAMAAAAKSGDMKTYRKLRAAKQKAG